MVIIQTYKRTDTIKKMSFNRNFSLGRATHQYGERMFKFITVTKQQKAFYFII